MSETERQQNAEREMHRSRIKGQWVRSGGTLTLAGQDVLKGTCSIKSQIVSVEEPEKGDGFEEDDWDRQMRRDAKAGAFDDLINEALKDHEEGRTTPLP